MGKLLHCWYCECSNNTTTLQCVGEDHSWLVFETLFIVKVASVGGNIVLVIGRDTVGSSGDSTF